VGSWRQRRDHPHRRWERKGQGETLGAQLEGASGSAQTSALGDSDTQEDVMNGPCRLGAQVPLRVPATPTGYLSRGPGREQSSKPGYI